MSLNRYARKVDDSQADIVAGLKECGWHVEIIGRPVDIAVRHEYWPINRWAMVEIKTPGRERPRKDRKAQNEFCARHRVPRLTTLEQVLQYLRELG